MTEILNGIVPGSPRTSISDTRGWEWIRFGYKILFLIWGSYQVVKTDERVIPAGRGYHG